MIKEKMILIAKKHSTWVDIVTTFGCTETVAEDIVQEMYYKIQLTLEKGKLDIMYNNEINYYYIFKTLKTLFYDLKRKSKNIQMHSIDDPVKLNIIKDYDTQHSDIDFAQADELVKQELAKMYWYDRKVFEVINNGESIADFSRNSKIKYYALYFTYKKVKDKLKKLL